MSATAPSPVLEVQPVKTAAKVKAQLVSKALAAAMSWPPSSSGLVATYAKPQLVVKKKTARLVDVAMRTQRAASSSSVSSTPSETSTTLDLSDDDLTDSQFCSQYSWAVRNCGRDLSRLGASV